MWITYNLSAHWARHITPEATLRGIDVSRYQGTIDWDAVKSGLADGLPVQAAFIKCGQLDYLDPTFKRNWSEAKRVGVKRGAYWFSDHGGKDPVTQAWKFWDSIKNDIGEYRPVIDAEYPMKGQTRAHFGYHMRVVREFESISGITPTIYTASWWWDRVTDGGDYSRYPLWVAQYAQQLGALPIGWKAAAMWQYTDGGTVNGIIGGVDCNKILNNNAILLNAPIVNLPTVFPSSAKTIAPANGYRRPSESADTLYSADIENVDVIIHNIDDTKQFALTSMTSLRAWMPIRQLKFDVAPKPEPPPVTPQPPTARPIRLGYNVLNAGQAMAKADAGCRFFMLMDLGVARAIKRKYPDAVVMVRWYHNRAVSADDIVRALAPSMDDELVFTGLNECDWLCYGTVEQIRQRAALDVAVAQRIRERAPKSIYAAGTFSVGTPDYTNPAICDAMRTHYAPHYNSGLLSIDYHSYTPSLTAGFDIWYARRWQFLFDKCGFDLNSASRIYSGETGVDDGRGRGFVGVGATQAQVNDWVIRFKALQSQAVNGQPSPFVGGAVFCLGENGDKRWLPFKADGYEVIK